MDPRFLHHYHRELQHLRDMAGEFAAEYPKIAGRLSLDGFECADPYVERLLEGFAFLAARVQVKFDSGYGRFTQHLLETVCPGLLAPLPSMLVAELEPEWNDPALARGYVIPRGTALQARVAPGEQTGCEFRTAHALTLWPLRLGEAEYLPRPAALEALGLPPQALATRRPAQAGLRLRLDVGAGLRASQLALERLTLFLRGADRLPARLHEQLLGHALGFVVRPADGAAGTALLREARHVRPLGFEDEEALLPVDARVFSGYRLLQEYFAFPSRFHFVALEGLTEALARCEAGAFEIVLLFDQADPALERAVDASAFALHAVPAVNLFPRHADRVLLEARETEHHLVVDRLRPLDFELHSVLSMAGHGPGRPARPLRPFYAPGREGEGEADGHGYWTLQRRPRQASTAQRRARRRSGYLGSEAWVSLVDGAEAPLEGLRELSAQVLCTHRDLPLLMPLGGGDDFAIESAAPLAALRCLKGPTPPRAPHPDGEAHWRLIRLLSTNVLGLAEGPGAQGAAVLRDLLEVFADRADPAVARQLAGVLALTQRGVHRRLPAPGPIAFGRGLEITLECDEAAFEGGSAFLLGSVLEQFFARYAGMNGFTETVLRCGGRGEVMRWAARPGRRTSC